MLSINYPLAYNAVVGHAAHIPTRRPPRSAGVTIQGGRLMLDGQPLRLSWATFTNAAGVLKSTDAALRALRAQIVADGCNAMRIRAPNARYWTQSVGNYGIYKTASNDATVANRVLYEEAALVQLDRSIAWALDAGIELIYLDFEGYDQIALRGANQRAGGTYNSNGMWWSAEYRALWWAAMLPVLTRVNTITGTRYCDDKRIIWLFNNENGPSQTYLASKSAWGSSAQTGTTTSGSAVVTGLDTSVLRVGMGVTGTSGISSSLTIQSVDSVSQVTLTGNASASGSRTITFTAHHFDKIIEGIDDSTGANGYWNTELVSLLTAFAAANSWTLPAWGRGATPAGGGAQGFPRQYVWANWGTLTDRENLVAFIDDVEYNATVEMLDLMKALRDDIIVCPGTFLYQSPRCSLALPSRFDNNVITEVHDYAYSGAGIGVQTGAGTTRQSMLDRTWANVGNGYGWVNSVCGVRNLKTPLISGECGQYSPNRWRFERMYLEMLVSLSQGYSAVQYADCQQDTADQALNVGIGQTSDHVGTGSSCDRLVREALSPALRYGFLAEASASFTIYSTRASLLAAQKAVLAVHASEALLDYLQALIAATGGVPMAEAVGAFVACGLLIVLAGLTRAFERERPRLRFEPAVALWTRHADTRTVRCPGDMLCEAERAHQRSVLCGSLHQLFTAGLVQEFLRRVQRRDDLFLQAPAHQCPGQKGLHLHAASRQRRLIRHRITLDMPTMFFTHTSSSKLAMSWRCACQSTIRRFR